MQATHSLHHILKVEARRPRHRLLCTLRQRLYPLAVTHPHPIRLDKHHFYSPAPRRPLQPRHHLPQRLHLTERQLALENHRGLLAPLHKALLQALHKRHRLLRLAHLRDAPDELFVVGEMRLLKLFTHEVDVLFLPGRVRGRREDGEFFGPLRVEGGGFAFGLLLQLVGFRGGDGGGGGADVFAGGGERGGGERNVGPEGVLDR